MSITFAVGRPEGPRGGVWAVAWAKNTPDIYLVNRSISKDVKASLHKSGRYRIAFTEHHMAKPNAFRAPDEDRAIVKWDRPAELGPGVTRVFSIVTPAEDVNSGAVDDPDAAKWSWHPKPEFGCAAHFNVFLTTPKPGAIVSTWPGQRGMGTLLVGSADLANGEKLWVTVHDEPMVDPLRSNVEKFREVARRARRERPEQFEGISSPRFNTYGVEDGVGVMLDVAVPHD